MAPITADSETPTAPRPGVPTRITVYMTPEEIIDNLELAAEGAQHDFESSLDVNVRRRGQALLFAVGLALAIFKR